jgi:hypothetical protein
MKLTNKEKEISKRRKSNKKLIKECKEGMVQHLNGLMSDYQLLCLLWRKSCLAQEDSKK